MVDGNRDGKEGVGGGKGVEGEDAGALTVGAGEDGGRGETQEISAGTGGAEDGEGWEEV